MKISSLLLENFGPIKRLEIKFSRTNIIIGTNGTGKTHVMRVLAGLCGNDEATKLLQDSEVGKCTLTVEADNRAIEFTCLKRFDVNKIAEFKSQLPTRVNFPITQWEDAAFPYNFKPSLVRRRNVFRYIGKDYIENSTVYGSGSAAIRFGKGYTRMLHILMSDSNIESPLLLEFPDQSLDSSNKRKMINYLTDPDRQTIFTTHAPEMLGNTTMRGSPDVAVIDVSNRS